MYYAMNAQGSQSLPSLVSLLAFFILGSGVLWNGVGFWSKQHSTMT
jgi:hypothetical protein